MDSYIVMVKLLVLLFFAGGGQYDVAPNEDLARRNAAYLDMKLLTQVCVRVLRAAGEIALTGSRCLRSTLAAVPGRIRARYYCHSSQTVLAQCLIPADVWWCLQDKKSKVCTKKEKAEMARHQLAGDDAHV